MSTIYLDDAQDTATLTPLDREWLRRQGRAARLLEARQRKAVRDRRLPRRARFAGRSRRSATRPRRSASLRREAGSRGRRRRASVPTLGATILDFDPDLHFHHGGAPGAV